MSKTINKAKPLVEITLDKVRHLKLDLNAMAEFEEATGKSFIEGKFHGKDMTPGDLRAMLWACLVHEDETLTEKQVGSWIVPGNMLEVTSKLNDAFEASMPETEKKSPVPLAKKTHRG